MRNLRKALAAVAAVSITVALLGCDRTPGTPDAPDTVTLRAIGEGYPPLLALEQVSAKYEELSGVKVEFTKRDHMAVVTEMDREFSAGDVTYDIVIMPHRLLGKLVEGGNVQPIDTFVSNPALLDVELFDPENDIFPGWLDEVGTYRGERYGVPFMALSMYTWYRKDLFDNASEQARFREEYGRDLAPPRTWDEYEEVARFFHRPEENLYGTGIQGARHVALWYEWLAFATGFGAKILDSPSGSEYGDIVVNSPEAIAATTFYKRMLDYSSPDSLNHTWDDALSNFQQGRTAIAIMWHDSAPWVEDPADSPLAGRIGYAPPPSTPGDPVIQLEGHTFLIPSSARHPEEAFEFIAWSMEHLQQLEQTLAGGLSARTSTYEEPAVQEIPYLAAFRAMLDTAMIAPKPTIPESDLITEAMTLELSRIMAGEVSVQAGLDRMAVEIKSILGDKAELRFPPPDR